MGGVYSEEALDAEAEKYITEQTREDLMMLQTPDYCNDVLDVVSEILRAVEWPSVFSFKGRIMEPDDRALATMARYYIQVAQMFSAGVRASQPELDLRPYFDTVYTEKGYTASAASLAAYRRILAAEACEMPGIDPLALASTYKERVAQRKKWVDRVCVRVQFPQMGELARTMADIKEELKRLETLEINKEIKYRAEVLEARLRFDLLTQRIEFLENL